MEGPNSPAQQKFLEQQQREAQMAEERRREAQRFQNEKVGPENKELTEEEIRQMESELPVEIEEEEAA